MVGIDKRLFLLVSALGLILILWPGPTFFLRAQLSTADHLSEPGFWPTQNAARRSEFVGVSGCASCHAAIVATQTRTPMGTTAMRARDSDILHSHSILTFGFDKYRYEIKTS